MQNKNMIEQGDRVIAGVSGGADSVCLCRILAELSTQMDFSLEVIHVEHGIRGEESRHDATFVRELCGGLGIPYREISVDVPQYAREHHLGLEEAARLLRYQAFTECAGEVSGTKIALAHHMEDNAETLLLQMIRGSGLDGLCGMRPVRRGSNGEVYIRPLLAESRSSIERFLADVGQDYCMDSTNEDLAYSRNRIRHKVLPELMAINPQALHHMNQAAGRLADVRDYMEQQTDACEHQVLHRMQGMAAMSVKELGELPHPLRIRLIHRAVSEAAGAKKDIAETHLTAVEQLLWKQTGRRVDLPYALVARREYGDILFFKGENVESKEQEPVMLEIHKSELQENRPLSFTVQGVEFTCRIFQFNGNFSEIPRNVYTKWLDYDMIKDSFSVRTRRPGDFYVLDEAGHHKKLEDYFVNEKVPARQRDHRLLVTQDSKVLWIVGGRMGYGAGISQETQIVLEITCEGGKSNGLQ
jgi:tRNA(Ile)-lysidine synthase